MGRIPKPLSPADEAVAAYLLESSTKLGISQRELARRTGMSQNRIGTILRRETPPASIGEIITLAEALNLPINQVLKRAKSANL